MKQFRRLLVAFSFSLITIQANASDWPTYMHDNSRVGYTADTLKTPLIRQWVYVAPTEPKRAWPSPLNKVIEGREQRQRVTFDGVFNVAVANGKVYFGSSVDHQMYCLDAKEGTVEWSFFTDGPIRLAPTVWKDSVYFGSDDGVAYCLDAKTGIVKWKHRAGPRDERILARGRMISRWPVRTGVLIDDGVAYFGAGVFPNELVYLYAVDAESGRVIWKNDTISETDAGRNDLTPQGYLLATKDTLFVPSGRSLPAAFSRKTGELMHKRSHSWRRDAGGNVGGSRAMLADGQLYTVGEHHVLAMEQQRGGVGFGWFKGRVMTMAGGMGYMADGKKVVAIDRVAHAVASREAHRIEGQVANLDRELRRHRALRERSRYDAAAKRVKAEKARVAQLEKREQQNPLSLRDARAALKAAEKALGKLESVQQDYRKKVARIAALRKEIARYDATGRKWTVRSPHESSMILAGNTLIVGGVNEVVVYKAESGTELFKDTVKGEVRGLAVSDGRLIVSTSTGRIYAYGSDAVPFAVHDEAEFIDNPYGHEDALRRNAAEEIIKHTGVTRGYCLVIGAENGRLAFELAKRTKLNVYAVDGDPKKVAEARRTLAKSGHYGVRIVVDHVDTALPHVNYFANLIVSDSLLTGARLPDYARGVERHLKPCGGVVAWGAPTMLDEKSLGRVRDNAVAWFDGATLSRGEVERKRVDLWEIGIRNKLPGAKNWSHQYGNPAATSSVEDTRVKDGLSVLWYGDPGPGKMQNRHVGAVGPVSANGRLFMQGDESIMAHDAYNGLFLWEHKNPGAVRTGVFNNYEPGNLVASDDSLFMVIGDKCIQYNGATGEVTRTHAIPDAGKPGRAWGFIAYRGGVLFGTSTLRKDRRGGRGKQFDNATDKIFAIDTKTGKRLWTYLGKSISHTTVAIGDGKVFFIDSSITSDQREALLKQDKTELKKLTGEARKVAEDRHKKLDLRLAVAIDTRSGDVVWSKPTDVTDCSGVGIGAGQLTLMYHDNHVVICGANANGHYWNQFLAGEFKRRRLVVLSGGDGYKLWSKDANYRHRPIVLGNQIIAEPWSFDLESGKQLTRKHPITGEETPWKFIRPGHHCGAISATPGMMFYRSGYTAFYDMKADNGTQHFAGHRLGCWINTIPANGLVMIPEASAGCNCLFSIASTVVFEPRSNRAGWGVYTAEGAKTPVQHLALNLGRPGDRRDAKGRLWLAWPRPSSRAGLDLSLNINPRMASGGAFFHRNEESFKVPGAEVEWVHSSGGKGLKRFALTLVGKQKAEIYTVRLYLTAPAKSGTFSAKLQGKVVAENVDASKRAGGVGRALVMEFSDVEVGAALDVELTTKSATPSASELPSVNGVEVIRKGSVAVLGPG